MPNIIVVLKEGSDAQEFIGRPGSGISAAGTKVVSKRVLIIPMNIVTDDYLKMLQSISEVECIDLALKDQDVSGPDWEYIATVYGRIVHDINALGEIIEQYNTKEM